MAIGEYIYICFNNVCLYKNSDVSCVGMTLYGLHQIGGILQEESVANAIFGPSAALLFGTICSAVDPVAVSMFADAYNPLWF